jgi:hypothetical protein
MDHGATLANLGALNPYAYVYSVFTLALRGKSVSLTHEKKGAIRTIGGLKWSLNSHEKNRNF